MANLSQNDRTIIAGHPLDISFDHLWEPLRNAEQDYRPRSISHDVSVGSLDSVLQKAISRLFNVLRPRGCLSPLLKDWKWQYSHWIFKTFWTQFNAAVTIIKTTVRDHALSSDEPPMSTSGTPSSISLFQSPEQPLLQVFLFVSFDGIPITKSSSFFQGSEQTRRIIEPEMFYETKSCPYRDVDGFFHK